MTYSYIMGRILLTLLFITCLSVRVFAQGNDSSVGNEFKDFREELQNEYVDFRKEINAEYIEFLSRAWKEYRLFQGRTPDETPKPLSPVLPSATPKPPSSPSASRPSGAGAKKRDAIKSTRPAAKKRSGMMYPSRSAKEQASRMLARSHASRSRSEIS